MRRYYIIEDNFVRYINIYQTSKSYWLSDVKLSNG